MDQMEVTLKDLLAEIRNLSFLFYGYTVIWVILLGYLFWIGRRESQLRDEIQALKKSLIQNTHGKEESR